MLISVLGGVQRLSAPHRDRNAFVTNVLLAHIYISVLKGPGIFSARFFLLFPPGKCQDRHKDQYNSCHRKSACGI